jgi:hypothetical protein
MQLKKMTMNPWDFTLYSADDGSRVIKIIFSEGDYKIDVERYFVIAKSHNEIGESLDELKLLANNIRAAYPEVPYPEIKKSDLTIAK